MFSLKSILLLAACLVVTASASPIEFENFYEPVDSIVEEYVDIQPSPQGNLDFRLKEDPFGRQDTVTYTQNRLKSNDGHGTIDAYTQGVHNFDYHKSTSNGGIRGSYNF